MIAQSAFLCALLDTVSSESKEAGLVPPFTSADGVFSTDSGLMLSLNFSGALLLPLPSGWLVPWETYLVAVTKIGR